MGDEFGDGGGGAVTAAKLDSLRWKASGVDGERGSKEVLAAQLPDTAVGHEVASGHDGDGTRTGGRSVDPLQRARTEGARGK